jgi:nucleotide-binding universal stress UspA family protein
LTYVNARVVGGAHSAGMYRRILVATDGSALAGRAVQHALSLAKAVGAQVTAFYAAPPYPTPIYAEAVLNEAPARAQYEALAQREAQRVLDAVARKAATAEVACETVHAISDAPWQAILDAARARKSDVIVMASHGRRGIAAVLLGSETSKVLTHARIPVVVVH